MGTPNSLDTGAKSPQLDGDSPGRGPAVHFLNETASWSHAPAADGPSSRPHVLKEFRNSMRSSRGRAASPDRCQPNDAWSPGSSRPPSTYHSPTRPATQDGYSPRHLPNMLTRSLVDLPGHLRAVLHNGTTTVLNGNRTPVTLSSANNTTANATRNAQQAAHRHQYPYEANGVALQEGFGSDGEPLDADWGQFAELLGPNAASSHHHHHHHHQQQQTAHNTTCLPGMDAWGCGARPVAGSGGAGGVGGGGGGASPRPAAASTRSAAFGSSLSSGRGTSLAGGARHARQGSGGTSWEQRQPLPSQHQLTQHDLPYHCHNYRHQPQAAEPQVLPLTPTLSLLRLGSDDLALQGGMGRGSRGQRVGGSVDLAESKQQQQQHPYYQQAQQQQQQPCSPRGGESVSAALGGGARGNDGWSSSNNSSCRYVRAHTVPALVHTGSATAGGQEATAAGHPSGHSEAAPLTHGAGITQMADVRRHNFLGPGPGNNSSRSGASAATSCGSSSWHGAGGPRPRHPTLVPYSAAVAPIASPRMPSLCRTVAAVAAAGGGGGGGAVTVPTPVTVTPDRHVAGHAAGGGGPLAAPLPLRQVSATAPGELSATGGLSQRRLGGANAGVGQEQHPWPARAGGGEQPHGGTHLAREGSTSPGAARSGPGAVQAPAHLLQPAAGAPAPLVPLPALKAQGAAHQAFCLRGAAYQDYVDSVPLVERFRTEGGGRAAELVAAVAEGGGTVAGSAAVGGVLVKHMPRDTRAPYTYKAVNRKPLLGDVLRVL